MAIEKIATLIKCAKNVKRVICNQMRFNSGWIELKIKEDELLETHFIHDIFTLG